MRRRGTPDQIHYLTQDELKRLLYAVRRADNKRDTAILLLAYRHGLRASEVGLLRISDIDFKRHRLYIRRVKGSISGHHTMQPDEIKLLKSYLRHRRIESEYLFPSNRTTPISRIQLHRLMKAYGEEAAIPEEKRHFHALKHSIGTHLMDAGADLSFVQDWLGHANIQNTRIYAQLTNPRRDEEARRLFTSPRIV